MVIEIIKGKITTAEVACSDALTVAEVEQWIEDFISIGTEALRCHPRDAEVLKKVRKKELLAKICDLNMQMEVYKMVCEVQEQPPFPLPRPTHQCILLTG